jgi:CheY-like chemotaxis protein
VRSRRSEDRFGARGPGHRRPARGDWRSRVHHRPDPGGAGSGRPQKSAPTVLLVDDERAIRTICRVNLEGEGLKVREAADGAEALERLREQQPSIVLLDVMMPGIDGWSVAKQLAGDPATRDIPVVFLSALAGPEDKLRAQELGAVGYIVKPFDPLELADFVRDVLERIERGERDELNRELSEHR